MAEFDKKY